MMYFLLSVALILGVVSIIELWEIYDGEKRYHEALDRYHQVMSRTGGDNEK